MRCWRDVVKQMNEDKAWERGERIFSELSEAEQKGIQEETLEELTRVTQTK